MIDLHCHLLPGLDDGAPDVSVSLRMAAAMIADGVQIVACTPHFLPGVYHNAGPQIRDATRILQERLDQEGIPLRLITGADIHIVPDLVAGLKSGRLLALNDTRYVLVEPPTNVVPVRMEEFLFSMVAAGFVPIVTHPERLGWIGAQYALVQRLVQSGVWMQITAGSLAGTFGRNAQYWAERMLMDGCVHILATDAHDDVRRPPILGRGRALAAKIVGEQEATCLVATRPAAVVLNELPSGLPMPRALMAS